MRLLFSVFLFLIASSVVFADSHSAGGSDANLNTHTSNGNNNVSKGDNNAMNPTDAHTNYQAQTNDQELNQTLETNQTRNSISNQVHQLIEQRKNGSITIPQGLLVRIEAHNHVMNVGNETQIMLNETLQLHFNHNGKDKSITLKPESNGMSITDSNITAQTNETLEIANKTLKVGGKSIAVMPSDLPELIRTRKINSIVLQIASGEPVYAISATKKAKVFWFFDADMEVETTIDANTGQVVHENGPWWAFLANVQED